MFETVSRDPTWRLARTVLDLRVDVGSFSYMTIVSNGGCNNTMSAIKLPTGLSVEAIRFWPDVQEELEGNDLLRNTHMLHQFLENYSQWRYNLGKVRVEGPMIETKKGLVDSPYQLAADRNERKMAEILRRHGSNPLKPETSLESDSELNAKQRLFIREYMVDRNGTQAAIRAGYSAKSAGVKASELLRNTNIRKHVSRLQRQIASDLDITAQMVYQGLLDEAQGIGLDTNSAARTQAWLQLAKLKGMFREDNAQKAPFIRILNNLDSTALHKLQTQLEQESEVRTEKKTTH